MPPPAARTYETDAGPAQRKAAGRRPELSAAAVPGKPLFAALLLIGTCRFTLTGSYEAGGAAVLRTAAGWTGVALAAFALYGGFALLLEDTAQRTVLPLGRRGRARTSLRGDLGHQLHRAEREAGVRRQL
ncbi:hypothetical protein [Streptomyces sp. NPDC054783]